MNFGTVDFTDLRDVSTRDWDIVVKYHEDHHRRHLADEMLRMLDRLKGPKLGFRVDRYEHALQTATRALRDGADEETTVCAVFHDIGDLMAPENHADVAADILKPYVSEENYWVVKNHVMFSGYYFFHLGGQDRHRREQLRDHGAYDKAKHFVDEWDARAFDPDYDTLPLSTFEPMIRRVLARKARSQWREVT